jgi:mono/diheme cytochrome c family protein
MLFSSVQNRLSISFGAYFMGPVFWLSGLAVCGIFSPLGAQEVTELEVLFVRQVWPTLQDKCLACHGADPDDLRGELDLSRREGLVDGGESEGPAWLQATPLESPLLHAVRWNGLEMPPKENDRLSKEQIEAIETWLVGGAVWPDAERVEEIKKQVPATTSDSSGRVVKTSGGLSAEWTDRLYREEDLWAYQPLSVQPHAERESPNRNPVDDWVARRLAEYGVENAPEAERRTLIRRATYDLTGLPPTPEEIHAFLNDPSPTERAFSTLVDRLLESPHYGEHWGRHWLDVVRYADSSGFANDYERGNAWRYRDYIVRCFNEDRPYDQMIMEQIAGDELDPNNPEMLVAVGFLRMGPWELTGMEVAKVARQRFLDDVTDSVGQVFLAHMLQCARCHDHKFDPIPTRDYYGMQAVFATTQLVERQAAFLPSENTDGFEERAYLDQRAAFYRQVIDQVQAKQTLAAARKWYLDQRLDSADFERVVKELRGGDDEKRLTIFQVRDEMSRQNLAPELIPPRHVGFNPEDFGRERVARKGLARLQWQNERYEPFALSVYNGETPRRGNVHAPLRMPAEIGNGQKLDETFILTGGDPFSPAEKVLPGTLSVISGNLVQETENQSFPVSSAGRRTALAQWIASPENPLTARVMVNRIWQWHFGRPLAGNPNNFGATGKRPSHPELLDELSQQFIDSGWSIKSMHRLLMNSRTYRQASQHPDAQRIQALDQDQTLYAQFYSRRLEAEEIRDSMLKFSGELNPAVGGIPVRPQMNLEVALQPRQVMGTFAEAWQPSPLPEMRHRRSIYALKIRGLRDPFFEVLNVPTADASCEAREQTTVTPQVFALFNSEITYERSLALAFDVLREEKEATDAVEEIFYRVLGRPADEEEKRWSIEHWNDMTQRHRNIEFEPRQMPSEVERIAVEENTGEKFKFVEPLEFHRDFVPDIQPEDVDARTRGLAELCLVLLNSNEFVYLD